MQFRGLVPRMLGGVSWDDADWDEVVEEDEEGEQAEKTEPEEDD